MNIDILKPEGRYKINFYCSQDTAIQVFIPNNLPPGANPEYTTILRSDHPEYGFDRVCRPNFQIEGSGEAIPITDDNGYAIFEGKSYIVNCPNYWDFSSPNGGNFYADHNYDGALDKAKTVFKAYCEGDSSTPSVPAPSDPAPTDSSVGSSNGYAVFEGREYLVSCPSYWDFDLVSGESFFKYHTSDDLSRAKETFKTYCETGTSPAPVESSPSTPAPSSGDSYVTGNDFTVAWKGMQLKGSCSSWWSFDSYINGTQVNFYSNGGDLEGAKAKISATCS